MKKVYINVSGKKVYYKKGIVIHPSEIFTASETDAIKKLVDDKKLLCVKKSYEDF